MDRPTLEGSEPELLALVDWLHAMDVLRQRLSAESDVDQDQAERIRLLTRRLKQAENRLRAITGLPPLM